MDKNLKLRINRLNTISELDPTMIKYYDHVDKHRDWVYKIASKLGIPERGKLHDLDKYDPKRAAAYANHWFNKRKSTDPEYIKYKNIHVKTNKHHPEYWFDKPEIMDFDSFLEMIADWIASGIVNEKNYTPRSTYRYYLENNKTKLDPLPGIKKAAEEWMIKYGNRGNEYIDRDKIKEIYDKYNKGLLSENEKAGKVDLSK